MDGDGVVMDAPTPTCAASATVRLPEWLTPHANARVLAALAPLRGVLRPWPVCLPIQHGDRILPLMIGAMDALAGYVYSPADLAVLEAALDAYVRSDRYLCALCELGAKRHDLAGRPVAPVAADHAAVARHKLRRRLGYLASLRTPKAAVAA
jgi:sRNA-binding protein